MSNLNPEILAELRKGDLSVLKGVHPLEVMKYGMAIQQEQDKAQEEKGQPLVLDMGLANAVLARMQSKEGKEHFKKLIEEQEQELKDKATE